MKNLILLIVLSVFLQFSVAAQWSTNAGTNNVISNMSGEQAIPKIATAANGDSYFGFFSNESGNYNMRLQRLDAQGHEMWASNGILISSHTQMTWLTDWDMTVDASGYAILAFQDIRNSGNNNVVAYRIAPDGTFTWGANGIALSNSGAFDVSPKVVTTAAGNAVFAWQSDDVIILQKVDVFGNLQWGTGGIILSCADTYSWPQLLPVGTDDVILKYFHDTGPSYSPTRYVYAQKYNSSGAAVWTSAVTISNAAGISAWNQVFPFINDGSDGFYIAWHDDRDNNMDASVFVQHIDNAGNVMFTANGVEVCTSYGREKMYPDLAFPPGSTDIFVVWNEMNADQNQWGIYGQKLDTSGNLLWTSSGKVFIDLSTQQVLHIGTRNSPTDLIVIYEEYINVTNGFVRAMRIDESGSFVWTPNMITMCSVNSGKVHSVANHYNNNQWIAAWEDDRNGNKDIYAQNIQLDGSLGPYVPQDGFIEGLVSFNNGTADVTQATVTAGSQSVNPTSDGSYHINIDAGTYTVHASHQYAQMDSIPGVVVEAGQTTVNADFVLEVVMADLICKAYDLSGNPLNNVSLEIFGPADTLYGIILDDSLILEVLPYGFYEGYAEYQTLEPVYSQVDLGADNYYLNFSIDITGLPDQKFDMNDVMVYPNPYTDHVNISINNPSAANVHLTIYDMEGHRIKTIYDGFISGSNASLTWDGNDGSGNDIPAGIYLMVLIKGEETIIKKIIKE